MGPEHLGDGGGAGGVFMAAIIADGQMGWMVMLMILKVKKAVIGVLVRLCCDVMMFW